MGKLERAKIYILDGDGSGQKKKDDPKTVIDVCFNPKEYSLEKSVGWDGENAFTDAPQPEFTKPSAMTLSVTLQFDTYEERVSVREKYIKKLETTALMRIQFDPTKKKKLSPDDKKKASPPVCLFVWGRFTFKGVVESLSQKYTMFLSDGTPVRAECALKMRNVLTRTMDDDKMTSVASQEKSYTVKQGDRLDSIAADQYGDASRWTEIAGANEINDPVKDVTAGKVLKIPQ